MDGTSEVDDLEQARRRIQELEATLARYEARLTAAQRKHVVLLHSETGQMVTGLVRLRNRLFPEGARGRRAVDALLQGAVRLYKAFAAHLRTKPGRPGNYQRWLRRHDAGPAELARQRQTGFARPMPISLLTDGRGQSLAAGVNLVRSLLEQTYGDWEWWLAVEASRVEEVRKWLNTQARGDERLQVVGITGQGGLEAAAALAEVAAFVGVVGMEDALALSALFEMRVAAEAGADLLYCDEDALTASGERADPVFKPDWSPDTLRSHPYLGRLMLVRRDLFEAAGGFRPGFDGAEEYDLALRASERAQRIVRVPRVLYHRRREPVDALRDYRTEKTVANAWPEAGRQALTEHLVRLQLPGEVRPGVAPWTWHVAHSLPSQPLVSILIPNRDQADVLAACVQSIHRSTYSSYEIIIIENNSSRPETFDCYRRLQQHPAVQVLTWDGPFNYAAANNFAARRARGSVLLFLNNDMQVVGADWLERLLEQALRPEVGVAGAKLYYPDDTVQHAGVIVGIGGVAGHAHRGFPRWGRGHGNRLVTVQNLSAVTAACLMTRRLVFEEAGGFDEDFILAFNDVDLCLAIREHGYAIVWTPFAELYHFESKTRGEDNTPDKQVRYENEFDLFRLKWRRQLAAGDPFYSPNLTLAREDFSLGAPAEIVRLDEAA